MAVRARRHVSGFGRGRADTGDAATDVVNPLILPQVGGGAPDSPDSPGSSGWSGWFHSIQPAPVRPSSVRHGHHRPGEPAGAAVVVAQEHGSEGDRRHIEADLHEGGAASGLASAAAMSMRALDGNPCGPSVLGDRQRRGREHEPMLGRAGHIRRRPGCRMSMRMSARWTRVPSSRRMEHQHHPKAHQSRTPQEWSRWPCPSTVNVSPPTVTVPRDEAGDLVAGGQVVVVGDAVGRPGQVEVETRRGHRLCSPDA